MKINLSWNEFMDLLPTLLPVLIPIMIIVMILMVTALISLLKKQVPFSQKILWLVIILFVNLIGPIIYFAVGAKILDEKSVIAEEEEE